MEKLLKTSEVGEVLGVSRQHVVDMCDRGEVSCIRVGRHRRVPGSEVERLTSHQLTREEERSLWLHRALLASLLAEPDRAFANARANLRRWRPMHRADGITTRYLTKWERVLNAGIDAVAHVLTSPSEDARAMRQNSPFAGVLPDETRRKVLQAFTEHWNREHEQALTQ